MSIIDQITAVIYQKLKVNSWTLEVLKRHVELLKEQNKPYCPAIIFILCKVL
jgi:hypothetical protein